jgi:galactitol-specific phosphotransferase system IIC component
MDENGRVQICGEMTCLTMMFQSSWYNAVQSTLQVAVCLFGVAPEVSLLATCTFDHSQRARVTNQREQAQQYDALIMTE